MSSIRVRHGGVLGGAVATCLLAAGPAAAAPATVAVANNSFTPATVAVAPGESVTWNWTGSDHNVKLSGAEAFTTPFNSTARPSPRASRRRAPTSTSARRMVG